MAHSITVTHAMHAKIIPMFHYTPLSFLKILNFYMLIEVTYFHSSVHYQIDLTSQTNVKLLLRN